MDVVSVMAMKARKNYVEGAVRLQLLLKLVVAVTTRQCYNYWH